MVLNAKSPAPRDRSGARKKPKMEYKKLVIERFPDAHPVATQHWAGGSPRHMAIMAHLPDGSVGRLDIHDDDRVQMHMAAWRSAHFWCVRNPVEPVTKPARVRELVS